MRIATVTSFVATFIGVLASSTTSCLADQTAPTDAPDLTPPENDRCVDATKLEVGVPVDGGKLEQNNNNHNVEHSMI